MSDPRVRDGQATVEPAVAASEATPCPPQTNVNRPAKVAARRTSGLGEQTQPLVGPRERSRRDLPGPLRTAREDLVQFGGVVEVVAHPLPDRRHELDQRLRDVLLQVAVPLALVALLQLGRRPAGEGG